MNERRKEEETEGRGGEMKGEGIEEKREKKVGRRKEGRKEGRQQKER